ncbi:DUF1203 domain-containing protein [Flavobacterium silvisoli]|uniref:DUF1203 domain-containing protein n=1 Tax=Flavobacterium silvisoli TaxID=2529433 RepID=UPI001F01C799|nr:DUF1203 domain-containing protein [Flavobacterium silvisoli]
MTNNFKLIALNKTPFTVYFDLPEDELERMNIKRMIVDKFPGFPCRVSLEDAEIGEEVVLLNFEHHAVPSPYRANGPIFIRKKSGYQIL